MIRTVLVTRVENIVTKEIREIYGRYDAVKLNNDGYKIISAEKKKFTMSDSDFVRYGTEVIK